MARNEYALIGGAAMGLASYEIVGSACEWRVSHDGKAENVYETKESAFEAAVATASLAIRQGHEVRITAPARAHSHGQKIVDRRSKMAVNKPVGDNARKGPVKKRSQLKPRRRQRMDQVQHGIRRVCGGKKAREEEKVRQKV
jgi:hypothetical protein